MKQLWEANESRKNPSVEALGATDMDPDHVSIPVLNMGACDTNMASNGVS
jgi:hypothetical protein